MKMDNIKKSETLLQSVRLYSEDIGMELMKSGKQHMMEWLELLNQVVIRLFGEKEY